MIDKIFRTGFIVAGLANIGGILLITKGMTSSTLYEQDPEVFSKFGILMIMLWGLAYIGTSRFATTAVLLPAAFAVEKLAYTLNWVFWITENDDKVTAIQSQDFLAGLFMGGYGINDGLFFVFFALVAIVNLRRNRT